MYWDVAWKRVQLIDWVWSLFALWDFLSIHPLPWRLYPTISVLCLCESVCVCVQTEIQLWLPRPADRQTVQVAAILPQSKIRAPLRALIETPASCSHPQPISHSLPFPWTQHCHQNQPGGSGYALLLSPQEHLGLHPRPELYQTDKCFHWRKKNEMPSGSEL